MIELLALVLAVAFISYSVLVIVEMVAENKHGKGKR